MMSLGPGGGDRADSELQAETESVPELEAEPNLQPVALRRRLLSCPVTALAFVPPDQLLVAQDTDVEFYDRRDAVATLIGRVSVLDSQAVLGLKYSPGVGVLVWGGRQIALLPEDRLRERRMLETASDWILDADVHGIRAVLATARNRAIAIDLAIPARPHHVVAAPTPAMLYSASVHWLDSSKTSDVALVAAGTVFGTIYVWRAAFSSAAMIPATVLHVLTGHRGSVLAVSLSADLRLLASCSDDRSVRVWRINATASSGTPSVLEADTGFGCTTLSSEASDNCLVDVGLGGHQSRIWAVRFVGTQSLYSFGEDAAVCAWRLRANNVLDRLHTRAVHCGRHIWAAAVEGNHIATGGADGAVYLLHAASDSPSGWPVASQLVVDTPSSDCVAALCFLGRNANTVLAATTSGRLLRGRVDGGSSSNKMDWTGVQINCTLSGCTAMCSASTSVAVLATSAGQLLIYRDDEGTLTRLYAPGRTRELVSVADSSGDVIICLDKHASCALYWSLRNESPPAPLACLHAGFDVCSAALVGPGRLVLGSRDGFVAVLRRHGTNWELEAPPERLTDEAVSSVVAMTADGSFVVVTSRDSRYRILQLSAATPIMRLRHEASVAGVLGRHVERAWLGVDGHLILAGFRASDLVIWDETRRLELARIDCGGGHRSFVIAAAAVRIAFRRAGAVHVVTPVTPLHRLVRAGGHGREIRTVSCVLDAESGRVFIATGGEDTAVRLWEYSPEAGLHCAAVLRRHCNGLQCVLWAGSDTRSATLLSAGGREELFAWRISGGGAHAVCAGALAGLGCGDLRIIDMDVSISKRDALIPPADLQMAIALSDSRVATCRYSDATGFGPLSTGRYTGACITRVRIISGWLLTASTDGWLVVWRTTAAALEPGATVCVHQSAVKALTLWPRHNSLEVVVVSGGDDGALAVTVLDIATGCFSGPPRIVADAHAAAVCGLAVLPSGTDVALVSVGAEQKLRVWRLCLLDAAPQSGSSTGSSTGMAVELVVEAASAVADPADLAVVPLRSLVVVVGAGMEVWEVDGLMQ